MGETPAVTVCHMLMGDGANVYVYDPKVDREDAIREFEDHGMKVKDEKLLFTKSAEEAADGAHAIVVLTEWDEFKRYNYKNFYGRNMLNHGELESIGYEVHTLGKAKSLAMAQP